jgi:hypothetical protein
MMKKYRDFAFLQPKHWLGIVMMAVLLASCSNDMMVEEPTAPTTLRLTTRSGDGAAVSYPVSIYVMQNGVCQAVKTVTGADETVAIPLTVGTYDVYAVGGASPDDYTLPAAADASPATAITLKEGRTHGELMTASAQTTLTAGSENSVALQLRRKVLMLQTVTIAQAPASVTAVSVTVSPLSEAVTIAGNYSGTGGSVSVDLECKTDGTTWQAEANRYLLPATETPTVSIAITTAEGTRRYTRMLDEPFAANKKYAYIASYQAAAQLSVDLSAEEWQAEETVDFDFGEDDKTDDDNGGDNNDNLDNSDNIPAVGSTYQGCYVLAVDDADDHAEVTLLSPTELTDIYDANTTTMQANIDAALATVTSGGISGWRVPTTIEASLMYEAREAIGGLTAHNYLCYSNGTYRAFRPTDAAFTSSPSTVKSSTVLRPVATIPITGARPE